MPVTLHGGNGFAVVRLTGTVSRREYERWLSAFREFLNDHELTRLLVRLDHFGGWEMNSAWSHVNFGATRFNSIESLAFVGDRKWERWLAGFCTPFPNAETQFFTAAEIEDASEWLKCSAQPR